MTTDVFLSTNITTENKTKLVEKSIWFCSAINLCEVSLLSFDDRDIWDDEEEDWEDDYDDDDDWP